MLIINCIFLDVTLNAHKKLLTNQLQIKRPGTAGRVRSRSRDETPKTILKVLRGQNVLGDFEGTTALFGGKTDDRLAGGRLIELESRHEPTRCHVEWTGGGLFPRLARACQHDFDRGAQALGVWRFHEVAPGPRLDRPLDGLRPLIDRQDEGGYAMFEQLEELET